MKQYLKVIFLVGTVGALSACLEVENDDNDDVVEALDRQSDILEQQEASVTLYGSVNDLRTDESADATVRVKVGSTTSEPVSTADGEFQLTGVAPSSNFQLIVESPTDAFLPRIVFGMSRGSSSGAALQDIGAIGVSEGAEYSFAVVDQTTEEPIPGLVFKGSSSVLSGTGEDDYLHESTYDETTGLYSIELPEFIPLTLRAPLDVDLDGQRDYATSIFDNSAYLFIDSSLVANASSPEFSLIDVDDIARNVEVRVSVIDDQANLLEGAELVLQDSVNGRREGIYDSATGQYVLDVDIRESVLMWIPVFEVTDAEGSTSKYGGASISLSLEFDNSINVSVLGTDEYIRYTTPFDNDEGSIDIAVRPREIVPASQLELVTTSNDVGENYTFKAFYSDSISLPEGSARLVREDVPVVVRGNESSDDAIPAGATQITVSDIEIDLVQELSLNNTLLTLRPDEQLIAGGMYRYEVGFVEDEFSSVEQDLAGDELSFAVSAEGTFDIGRVVLDNDNFTTNGLPIVASNSAGQTANPYSYRGSVYMHIPADVNDIESLVFTKTQLIDDGILRNDRSGTYTIVSDGQFYFSDLNYHLSLASNENIISNTSIRAGTAVADGFWRRVYVGEYLRDNTPTLTNEITFNYVLERKNGDVETGAVVLPVR